MENEKIVSIITFAELWNLFRLINWIDLKLWKKIGKNIENEKIVLIIIFAELWNLFGLVN